MSVESFDMSKAEAQLAKFADDDKVVIYINVKGTGRSVTLGARGGVMVSIIRAASSLAAFLTIQADGINWDDVISIEFEEFY